MLSKRIIVCLDVRDGKTTKGVRFQGNVDVGDPVAMAGDYYEHGVDELVFYDIGASPSHADIMIDVVREVAGRIAIPFSVGGGLRSVDDMRRVLLAGADKVSIDTAAVRNPALIGEGAARFGSQCIVVGMQVRRVGPSVPSGYEVYIEGARTPTGLDALEWARRVQDLGAGEVCVNSIDADGTKAGYDVEITRRISDALHIPVIASGGAGEPAHLARVLTEGRADAALIASMVHFGTHTIGDIKAFLAARGIPVRPAWSQAGIERTT
ncbi:MAG: imidazole glycerol phosphate synthase subunit HisF [Candidatus Brocadiaceae bacterium]|nr:imidazole glycerol phosphate synthase subunit HisF [Candidatus Brocadiaceae bacterium]